MAHLYAYRRQIPGFASLVTQQHEIIAFAKRNEFKIDKEVIEYATKDLFLDKRQEFEDFLRSMEDGNIVIVSTLTILSTRAEELIKVINCMLTHNVDLWVASHDMLINRHSSMVDIFPLLNILRDEEREKSTQIGRPKGSKSNSKFDIYHSKIVNHLIEGLSVSAIARNLEVSRSSLKDYIESRHIKDLVKGVGRYLPDGKIQSGMDNIILICPFELESQHKIEKKA